MFYRKQVFEKLEVENVTEALSFAINYGLFRTNYCSVTGNFLAVASCRRHGILFTPYSSAVWGLSDSEYQTVDPRARAGGTLQMHQGAVPTAHRLLSTGSALYAVRGV